MSFSIKLNKSNNFSFRVNPSSSSIAYTLTLPRITLSLRVKRRKKKPISKSDDLENYYKPVRSATIVSFQSEKYEAYNNKISKIIKLNRLSNFLIASLLALVLPINLKLVTLTFALIGVIGIILKIYLHTGGRFKYDLLNVNNQLPSIWPKLAGSDGLWQVVGICELDDNGSKKNAGISTLYERKEAQLKYKTPYYIHTRSKVLQVKLDDYRLIILPGHYIAISKNEVAMIETGEVKVFSETVLYAETESLPKDANVVNRTWRYVNKDGSMDKRYRDNEKVSVCEYQLVRVESESGFRLVLLGSSGT